MSQDPFAFMEFTYEEALEADRKLRTRNPRDQRVCACGHPMGRHTQYGGFVTCKPSAMDCLCKVARPVLEASDVRPFLRKTEGPGLFHALGRGMAAAKEKGVEIKWIIDPTCDKCQKTNVPLSPVPVSQHGTIMNEGTGYDKLLCSECREALR